MAGYRGHLSGAVAFFMIYFGLLAAAFMVDAAYTRFSLLELIGYPLAMFGLCIMFGLWPDVDTNSVGQNVFYTIFLLIDVVLIATRHFEEAAYLGLFAILPIIGKHRGWTHTWWAMVLIPSPLVVLPYLFYPERPFAGLPFYGAAVVGYLSHLCMDGLVIGFRRRKRARR